MKKPQKILFLILGCVVLSAISFLIEVHGKPPVVDPSPRGLRLLWFWASVVTFMRFRFLTAAVLFLIAAAPLVLRGRPLSNKNLWLLAILSVLDVVYIAVYCRYGYMFFGVNITNAILAISLAWIIVIWLLLIRGLKLRSFWSNMIYKAALALWITCYAFPFFGAGRW